MMYEGIHHKSIIGTGRKCQTEFITFMLYIMHWSPTILYEDNHYVAISKPAALLVQPEAEEENAVIPLMQAFIGKRDRKPGKAFIGVVHRLDKSVSGVLILAKTSKGQERFNELLKNKQVKKYYLAITERCTVQGSGSLEHFMSRQADAYRMNVSGHRRSSSDQEAILKYEVLSVIDDYQLWAIELVTGRRHQIRAQLAHIGAPIVGDKKYGSKVSSDQIMLHCTNMQFEHPIKKTKVIVSDLPRMPHNFWQPFKSQIIDWDKFIKSKK